MLVSDLSPKEVFSYFKEISDIPRGSGNTDRIAQYCVDFANSHNLLVRRDEADNVVIFKDGSKGYEDKEPLHAVLVVSINFSVTVEVIIFQVS